jgi:hypothetical protein
MKVLFLAHVSNSDVHNTMKRLQPTKSVRLDGISSYVTKGCSEIVVPVLKFIFNLSPSQNTFPNLWKQAAVVRFQKGTTSSVGNYRPIAILSNFFKVSELIIHDISHFLKSKLNPSQNDFIKSKSTITNSVNFLDFVTPLVRSKGQSIYSDFSNSSFFHTHCFIINSVTMDCLPVI